MRMIQAIRIAHPDTLATLTAVISQPFDGASVSFRPSGAAEQVI